VSVFSSLGLALGRCCVAALVTPADTGRAGSQAGYRELENFKDGGRVLEVG